MTKAYGRFIDQNITFATSALICAGGFLAYLDGRIGNEPVEKRKKDGPAGDRMLDELLFASVVDNFNCFLADILVEVIEADPRPISGRKFDAQEAFSTDSLPDLQKRILEKFVLDLGYQNIDDLTEFLKKNFGLKSLDHWLTKRRVARYIQIRNVITHNRGLVNKTFVFRSKSKSDIDGQKVKVPNVLHAAKYFDFLAVKIDGEVQRKFFAKPEVAHA